MSQRSRNDPVVTLDRNFWVVTAGFAVLSIVGVIFWIKFPITQYLPAAVVEADEIDQLFRFLAASSTVLFIYVVGYLIYFSIAFRRRASDPPDAIGVQVHDNHNLELWWTIGPAIFVIVMAVFSVRIWYGIEVNNPGNGLTVESIGHQWNYTFRYPGVHGEIPDAMHLPVDVPVTLEVTSTDVIHSFWVPAMRLKADMVPGAINTLRFTPKYPGTYAIICTEFCGVNHSVMDKQTVVIQRRADFDKWYSGWVAKTKNVSDALPKVGAGAILLTGGNAAAGQKVFAATCSACHAVGPFAQRIVGPGLKGVLHDPAHPTLVDGDSASTDNVAKILRNGYAGSMGQMPNQTTNRLSDKDIANLVAYLDSLK
ncbi:MAG TPA: cytochrome c oxidase subunit II [Verrucomicrobiae bacterium]|nr:cytochrome c oxidase subunit II [Verrucomicrobiae bacterium]